MIILKAGFPLSLEDKFMEKSQGEGAQIDPLPALISLLQRENTFIKNDLNDKLQTIEKLLKIKSNQSKVYDINITDNAYTKNYCVFENGSENKENPSKKVKYQNKSGRPNLELNRNNSLKYISPNKTGLSYRHHKWRRGNNKS